MSNDHIQNVVEAHGLGWSQLIRDGFPCGFVYRWNILLECGHKFVHISEPVEARREVAAPAWVNCKQCASEARR